MPFLFLSLALAGALSFEQAPRTGAQVARISGRVVEEGTNAPLSGARVSVLSLDGPPSVSFPVSAPPQTITNEDGRFVFDGLPPGRYRMNIQKAGFASPLPPDPSAFRTFELAPGQRLAGVNISMTKGAVITGQILDPSSGEPLAGSMVMAMRRLEAVNAPPGIGPSGGPRFVPVGQSVQTNDLGEFRIFGLPPGEYFVAASRPPIFGFAAGSISTIGGAAATEPSPTTQVVMTFYPGTADESAAQPVAVAPGQVATGIVIRLLTARTYQVSGTVVDENGTPVAGAMVMLRGDPRAPLPFAPVGQGRADASGRFAIGGVTPGSYVAMASVPVQLGSQGTGVGVGSFSATGGTITLGRVPSKFDQANVTVTDANVEGVQIVVQRPQ
jgi:hypothetical protein